MSSHKSVGRPTKYRAEFCGMLKEHSLQKLTISDFARTLKVARATLYNWAENHGEFNLAMRDFVQKPKREEGKFEGKAEDIGPLPIGTNSDAN